MVISSVWPRNLPVGFCIDDCSRRVTFAGASQRQLSPIPFDVTCKGSISRAIAGRQELFPENLSSDAQVLDGLAEEELFFVCALNTASLEMAHANCRLGPTAYGLKPTPARKLREAFSPL